MKNTTNKDKETEGEKKMKESDFQAQVIKRISDLFPTCLVIKQDPTYIQGLPDLLVLYRNKWAALECKRGTKASYRPNQKYYIDTMNNMSFARSISPENADDVINELALYFAGYSI